MELDRTPRITGTCHPTKIHFSGTIKTDGPAIVTYRWQRSDATHKDETLQFSAAKVRHVETDWEVTTSASGWMQLIVLSPKRMESAKAPFTVNCGNRDAGVRGPALNAGAMGSPPARRY
jgi:hypothetical protein